MPPALASVVQLLACAVRFACSSGTFSPASYEGLLPVQNLPAGAWNRCARIPDVPRHDDELAEVQPSRAPRKQSGELDPNARA